MKNIKKMLFLGLIIPLISTFSLSSMLRHGKGKAAAADVDTSNWGKVIIVAGPSSCGKTMVTKRLNKALIYGQGVSDGNWVRVSLDQVSKEYDDEANLRGEDYVYEMEELCYETELDVPAMLLCDHIKDELLSQGINVVVDTVFDEDESHLMHFLARLFNCDIDQLEEHNSKYLTVFLHCSLKSLVQRVDIRNSKGDEEDTRSAGLVLAGYIRMVSSMQVSSMQESEISGVRCLEKVSPTDFEEAVNATPQLSPKIDGTAREEAYKEQIVDGLRDSIGLHNSPSEGVALFPKVKYDCHVRSDLAKTIEENLEFCSDNIIGYMRKKFYGRSDRL